MNNTLTIQVEDRNVMAGLKKMTGMQEAMDDIRKGRVTKYDSSDEMFKDLGL